MKIKSQYLFIWLQNPFICIPVTLNIFQLQVQTFFPLDLRENALSKSPFVLIDPQLIGGPLVSLNCCHIYCHIIKKV